MEELLVACIQTSLDHYMVDNATFLAERLVSISRSNTYQFPSEHSLYLLATCYINGRQPKRAYEILKGCTSPSNKYLFAVVCLRLNKVTEAEDALTPSHSTSIDDFYSKVPNGSFGIYLLGVCAKRLGRVEGAIQHLKKSLELNPLLWSAYEVLCSVGANVDPSTVFTKNNFKWDNLLLRSDEYIKTSTLDGLEPSLTLKSSNIETPAFKHPIGHIVTSTPDASQPLPIISFNIDYNTTVASTPADSHGVGGGLSSEVPASINPQQLVFATPLIKSSSHGLLADEQGSDTLATPIPMQTPAAGTTTSDYQTSNAAPPRKKGAKSTTSTALTASTSKALFKEPTSKRTPAVTTTATPKTTVPPRNTVTRDERAKSTTATSSAMSSTVTPSTTRTPPKMAPPKLGTKKGLPGTTTSLPDEDETPLLVQPLSFAPTPTPGTSVATKNTRTQQSAKSTSTRSSTLKTKITSTSKSRGNSTRPTIVENPQDSGISSSAVPKVGGSHSHSVQHLSDGLEPCLEMLRLFGPITLSLSRYDCSRTIDLLLSLPEIYYDSQYTLVSLARAYFEQLDYHRAKLIYVELRKKYPTCHTGLDYYSTILWYEQARTELSALSHELLSQDTTSPEAWCTLGNCFSLQKDHISALSAFNKAIQLNPNYAYAYTLAGHEYAAQDKMLLAIESYRQAISTDVRHYNGWYGLGTAYLKQNHHIPALYHFQRAVDINPHSSVLHNYLGSSFYQLKQYASAEKSFQKALELAPLNIGAQFNLICALTCMNKFELAANKLKTLIQSSPRSGTLVALLGKIYKCQKKQKEAVEEFKRAQDLDPQMAQSMAIEIESVSSPTELPFALSHQVEIFGIS